MSHNPIQYTSRTYNTIMADINSDPDLVDTPEWWKRFIAGAVDTLSIIINAIANNLYLRTAYTRQGVADLLELIDYRLTEQSTSTGVLLIYLKNTVTYPKTLARADIAGLTTGSISQSAKRFEGRESIIQIDESESFVYTAVNTTNDTITLAREYMTGEKVRFTGADLPAPLVADTDYYTIKVTSTEIKLATSLSNAYAGTAIDITAQGSGTSNIYLYSVRATVYQQELKDTIVIGTSNGVQDFQKFNFPDNNVLRDTVTVVINSETWERVETFVDSTATSKHYQVLYNTDNTAYLQFGGNSFGMVPGVFDISVTYAVGGGSGSNISVANKINVYGGSDSDVLGVSNPSIMSGGANPQSIEEGKKLGPILLKARDRFVTQEDGEALALNYGGLSQARVNPNIYGVLSVQVLGVANGGGNPGSTLKDAITTYLTDRTILESVEVVFDDLTITPVNVTSGTRMLPGYTFANVLPYIRLAWKLLLTETGSEIQNEYNENGISSTIVLINSILSEAFTIDDGDQISTLVANLRPRQIGEDLQASDVYGYIDSYVVGVDYITITLPTLPITIGNDEITTYGTLTLTEIV